MMSMLVECLPVFHRGEVGLSPVLYGVIKIWLLHTLGTVVTSIGRSVNLQRHMLVVRHVWFIFRMCLWKLGTPSPTTHSFNLKLNFVDFRPPNALIGKFSMILIQRSYFQLRNRTEIQRVNYQPWQVEHQMRTWVIANWYYLLRAYC